MIKSDFSTCCIYKTTKEEKKGQKCTLNSKPQVAPHLTFFNITVIPGSGLSSLLEEHPLAQTYLSSDTIILPVQQDKHGSDQLWILDHRLLSPADHGV